MKDFHTILYKIIGARIKNVRKKLNLSQEQLSEKVEISRASISNIEIGRHQPPLHILYSIASALQLDIQFLLPTVYEIREKITSSSLSEILGKEDLDEESKINIENIINNLSDDF